jgi:hypothetical protein
MQDPRASWERTLLAVLVIPMTCAVAWALRRGQQSSSALRAWQATADKHLPRDEFLLLTWLHRLKATVQALAFWYFGSAFLLTSPLLFLRGIASNNYNNSNIMEGNLSVAFNRTPAAPAVTFSQFVETDLLALKHMMHASFLLGGVRAVGTTGNRRYLEIVAAVTLLSSVPSFVSLCLGLLSPNTSLLCVCLSGGMFVVTAGSALAARQALRYARLMVARHTPRTDSVSTGPSTIFGKDQQQSTMPRRWQASEDEWRALSSLPSRIRALKEAFGAAAGPTAFRRWLTVACDAQYILYIELAFHVVGAMLFLSNLGGSGRTGTRQKGVSATMGSPAVDTVAAIVEATSLQLHWGFLWGNAAHGLNSMTPSCLDMFCWGKTLLVFVMVVQAVSAGGGSTAAKFAWRVAEVALHSATILAVRRARNVLGDTMLPFLETKFSCHQSAGGTAALQPNSRGGDGEQEDKDHGLSLWRVASSCEVATIPNSDGQDKASGTFRWFWFGRAAAVFSTLVWLTLCVECALLPFLAGERAEIRRGFGVGANFGLHAAAMFMLAQYRPVRDRREWNHSRSFNVAMCALFVVFFISQGGGSLLLLHQQEQQEDAGPFPNTRMAPVLRGVVIFNLFRLGIYMGLGSAFAMLPSSMPERLKVAGVPTAGGTTRAAAVLVPRTTKTIPRSAEDVLVRFAFVQWNGKDGSWAGSYASSLSARWRGVITRADRWTRQGWWWWALVATVFVGGQSGFWLGAASTEGAVPINLGCISMASSIAFHFLFILTGYSLRGLRSPHVPMLKLTSVTCACAALVGVAAAAACVREMDWAGALFMVGTSVLMGGQGIACWQASEVLQRHRDVFPRSGISHNWM